jgi:hypothetical protein
MLAKNRPHPRQVQLHRARSILKVAMVGGLGIGCSRPGAAADPAETLMFTDHVHMMKVRDRSAASAIREPSATQLALAGAPIYHGGKVIENVKVTQVLYGLGSYLPEITATRGVTMEGAYTQLVTSGVIDWLSEYNTASPDRMIGRGEFRRTIQIEPAASRHGSTISDAHIQSELASQIKSEVLPAPDDHQLYMVSFPIGKSLVAPDGSMSCVSDGFCAYHGTFKIGAQSVNYVVLPALLGACLTGCGGGTPFQNQQAVASHELIGAITNPEVGLATVTGSPLAWYDPTFGEIGDICNGQQGTYEGLDGNRYTLHKAYSSTARDCVITKRGLLTSDILWRNVDTGDVMEWLMASTRVAGPEVRLRAELRDWHIAGTGDFDGDGTSDILWRNASTGEVKVWRMANGRNASSDIGLLAQPVEWHIQGTGDFNGDGTSDILWRNVNSGTVKEWMMANGRVGSEVQLYTPDGVWQIQGTGDFNGDATADILWRNVNTGVVAMWLMANGEVAQGGIEFSGKSTEWQIQDTGDFNGDRVSDILWRNVNTGDVAEWMMADGPTIGSEIQLFLQAGEWQIQGAGDFNGDRTSDILWRNTNTGEVTEWIMADGQIVGAEIHLFARPEAWQIQGIGNLDGH